jgi:hypothetical protein
MVFTTSIHLLDSVPSDYPSFHLPPSISSLSQVVLLNQNFPEHCRHRRGPNKGELGSYRGDSLPFACHNIEELVEELVEELCRRENPVAGKKKGG